MTDVRTSKPSPSREARRIARAEAAAWIVRLHGPQRSPQLEAGFRSWLAADPENARQFELVTEVWDQGSTPMSGVTRLHSWPRARSMRAWAPAAAVLVALLGICLWGLHRFWMHPAYVTEIGEQRIVRLDDGSRLSLNSNTSVSVAYDAKERRLYIERGEAYFEVAPNRARPFVVVAGDRTVTAVGTAFAVRYEPERTAITLVEGKVAISSSLPDIAVSPAASAPRAGSSRSFLLAAGERLTFEGETARLDTPQTDAVTAWRRGEIVLDDVGLADAVADMNRYDKTVLVIDDPAVAGLRISGIYRAGDSEGFARTVARLYGLDVAHEGDSIRLQSAMRPENR